MLSKHMFIVFGGEHYNPLGIIRSLGEANIRPVAIVINDGSSIKLTSASKYISKLHVVKSVEEGYKVLMDIYSYNQEWPPFLMTGDDSLQSFLDLHYNDLKDKFIMYNAGEQGRITYFMDKNIQNQLAVKHGFQLLDTYVANIGEIPDNLEYPVMTKAIISTLNNWKSDVFVCHNAEELSEAYKNIRSEKVLLQKYIKKKNELCLEGCCVNKGNDVFVSMASRYNYILPDSYSPNMTISNYDDGKVLEKCRAMIQEIGFEGIFTIEFLVGPNDELYFLEINLRNSGWSYASTKVGMNLPVIWARGMINGQINNEGERKEIPSDFKAIVEFDDFRLRVKKGSISFSNWLRECKNTDCLFYFNKKDMRPVISMLYGVIKRKLKH